MLSVAEGLPRPRHRRRVFQRSRPGVNIDLISTSSITITCVVDSDAERAVRSLHEALELERES